MEQSLIRNFFKRADPNAPVATPKRIRSLQPMTVVPKAKRPVGRPRKRPSSPGEQTPIDVNPVLPSPKRIRASYTMKKKQQVVECARKHTLYQACKRFNLSKGTVWPWMSINFDIAKATVYRSSGTGRKLSYPLEKETELVQWVLEQRDIQLAMSVQSIINQAITIIKPVCPSFQGTRGWAHRFM